MKNSPSPTTWVFIRGLTRGSFHWLDFHLRFKDAFKDIEVLIPELAGNGSLYEQISPQHLDDAVRQLRQKLSLGKNQKIGLFTISMGGMIGTRWAEMFPDEVSHLVLVNTSFSSLSPFYDRLKLGNYPQIIKNFIIHNPEKMENFIMKATSNFEKNWRPHFEELVKYQKDHPISLTNFRRQMKMSGEAFFESKPQVQILVLASLKDRLVSCRCSQAIAKKWQVPIEIHPSAGHDLPLDDCPWTLDQIRRWIRS